MDHSQSYSQIEVSGLGQAELESRALVRTASGLNQIKENWNERRSELGEVLEKNRKLWAILASAMQEDDCPQPKEIRRNILSLAMFVFQRTVDILATPEPQKLDILININMNIAKGLSGSEGEEAK
ncbi:MAG: flagellar biosynthesis regulator FlaF [Alphaproteobacteria bacterium]|nr:flagellar biosynthesis regulator FlaF [Alphaproteobacteria bacterium]